jgi:two-component system sensor histidine kinase ArlS
VSEDNCLLALNYKLISPGSRPGTLLFYDISPEIVEIVRLSKIIMVVYAVIALFSIFSITSSGKGVFKPLKEMTETVRGISEKNLNARLNVSGSKNELKELAMTFNEMMNRIEDNYNRQKQFVSDASHELRTPISVIQGYIDMLDRWGKNDREILQESINAIKNESEGMKDLVEKLLFLARNDKGTLVLQMEEFSLNEMMDEVVRETGIIDNSHKLIYVSEKEISLYADRNRIKQAVRILVDNAIKYTPKGGEIYLTLRTVDNYICIGVRDTGAGMSGGELKHIFYRFYRTDKARGDKKGGHGLGLAIAKVIVLGHKGKINVKSRPGEGSEFTIILPANPV